MPYIAVVISGLSGRMNSGFELISRLEKEGHRVICLCQPYTTETVAKQGFDLNSESADAERLKVINSLKYTVENGNAARMAYHGMAVVGDKDEDGVAEIHENIRAVLTDSKYLEKISEFNGLYDAYSRRKLTPLIFK